MSADKGNTNQTQESAKITKQKKKIVYYAKFYNYSFVVPVVDENGKPKYKKNGVTGVALTDIDGNPIPIEKTITFEVREPRFSKGYVSSFTFDPNDTSAQNKVIGERLVKLSEARNTKVYTEDEYDKTTNYEKYLEKKRRKEIESENDNLKAKNADLEERLKALSKGSK